MKKQEKKQKEKVGEEDKNGNQEFSQVPEHTGRITAERIRSFPRYAHLTKEEAEAFAEYLAMFCKAVFLFVERQQGQNTSRGTPFDVEQHNKAA